MNTTTIVSTAALLTALLFLATPAHAQFNGGRRAIPGRDGGRQAIPGRDAGPRNEGPRRPCFGPIGSVACWQGPAIDVVPPIAALTRAKKDAGTLRLDITPSSAAVYVDGKHAGRVRDFDGKSRHVELTPGSHRIRVRAVGFEPMDFDARVETTGITVYHGTLQTTSPAPRD